MTTAVAPLPLTGERTVPGIAHENYWYQRHVAAYALLASRATGRRAIDSGSGEGYGTAMMARTAADVVGVELVEAVVAHARAAYPQVRFHLADVCDTGLPAGGVDLIASLQVIEHLPDVGRFMAEQQRLLSPGGELLVATPNRLTFTPHSHEPTNVFHVEEFSPAELAHRLCDVGSFTLQRMLGLHHGRRIRAVERLTGRAFTDLVLEPPDAWPAWLHTLVARLDHHDFVWRQAPLDDADLAASLDLLAWCST